MLMLKNRFKNKFVFFFLLNLLTLSQADLLFAQEAKSTQSEVGANSANSTKTEESTINADTQKKEASSEKTVNADDDLLLKTLELDIRSASFYELSVWCEREGLATTGSIDELRSRLYEKFGIKKETASINKKSYIITIESAENSSYFTVDSSDDRYLKLLGGVKLIMKEEEKNNTHTINADEILLNQTQNTMTASGNVVYKLDKADGVEYFYGDSFTVDLDTWNVNFIDGTSAQDQKQANDTNFRFEAESISRKNGNVLVLENGTITSSASKNPYYSIRASKVWILGGNEWAILNATLFVGQIPVFYFPFFYYPGDELVFNPVFGSRDREGRFIQTTTYLQGKKVPKTDTALSLLSIAKTGGEQNKVWKGFFLRSGVKSTDVKESANTIKFMADAYTNLGFFTAIDAKIAPIQPFNSTTLYLGLGFSRNVYKVSTYYTSTIAANNYQYVWNTQDETSTGFPLRFGINFQTGLNIFGINTRLQIPYYSDPFFLSDFMNRSEDMNWFSFLDGNSNKTGATTTSTQSKISVLNFKIENSFNPNFTLFAPFIQNINIGKLNFSLNMNSKTALKEDASAWDTVDPRREFFYPDQIVFFDTQVNMSGSLFKFPFPVQAPKQNSVVPAQEVNAAKSKDSSKTEKETDTQTLSNTDNEKTKAPDKAQDIYDNLFKSASKLQLKMTLRNPFIEEDKLESTNDGASNIEKDKVSLESNTNANQFRNIQIIKPESANTQRTPFAADVNYNFNLSRLAFEEKLLNATWLNKADIDYKSVLYTLYGITVDGTANVKLSAYDSLAQLNMSLRGGSTYQDHPYVSDNTTYNSATTLLLYKTQDYTAKKDSLYSTLSIQTNPFFDNAFFSKTNLTWSIDSTLYEYKFVNIVANSPVYVTRTFNWDKEYISAHQASFTFGISPFGTSETITVSATLPPKDESYSGSASVDLGFMSSSVSSRYFLSNKIWDWDPYSLTLVFKPLQGLQLSTQARYDSDLGYLLDASGTFNWGNLTARANARRSKSYTLTTTGWKEAGALDFRFSDFSANYSQSFKPDPFWKNRIGVQADISSNFTFNALQYTQSSLSLTSNLTFKVFKLIDLSLSTTSQNSSVYRYFLGLPGFTNELGITAVDPFLDIIKGFYFFEADSVSRKESLFKLKNITAKASIDLQDWTLSFDYTGKPELDTTGAFKTYKFNSYFTILIKWKAIPEFKTSLNVKPESITFQ